MKFLLSKRSKSKNHIQEFGIDSPFFMDEFLSKEGRFTFFKHYILLVEKFILLFDSIFPIENSKEGITITIDQVLEEHFKTLVNLIHSAEENKYISRYHKFMDSRVFFSLTFDHDQLRYIWVGLRPLFLAEIEEIKTNFDIKVEDTNINYAIKGLLLAIDEDIEHHQKKVEKLSGKPQGDKVYKLYYKGVNIIVEIPNGDRYKITNFKTDKNPDKIFTHLMDNPNRRVTKAELEKVVNGLFNDHFTKVLNDLGIKGGIKKLFFRSTNEFIHFRQSVPVTDFKSYKVDENALIKQLSEYELI